MSDIVERLRLYAEELIEPPDGDTGGARVRAAKLMRETADRLQALTRTSAEEE